MFRVRRQLSDGMGLIRRLTKFRYKGPTDALKKSAAFARINEFFGRQIISFNMTVFTLGMITRPFRQRAERNKYVQNPNIYEYEDICPDIMFRKFIEGRINKNERILDVGCNSGFHLGLLHDIGYTELYGIEPSLAAVSYAHEHRPYLKETVKLGFFGPKTSDIQAKFVMFINSADRVPTMPDNAGLFEAIDRCALEYVYIATGELNQNYPRNWVYEMARKGFLCIEKRVFNHSGIPIGLENTMGWQLELASAFLFRRLEPKTTIDAS